MDGKGRQGGGGEEEPGRATLLGSHCIAEDMDQAGSLRSLTADFS